MNSGKKASCSGLTKQGRRKWVVNSRTKVLETNGRKMKKWREINNVCVD